MSLLKKLAVTAPILSLLRMRSRRRDRVLLYHRVVGNDIDASLRALLPGALTCAQFAEQMRYLQKHYTVVALEELLARRAEPGNRVAITFDDGYADNLHNAAPILRELGLPATVFVVAGYVGTDRRFWWDLLARRIAANGARELLLEGERQPMRFAFDGSHARQLHAAAAWLACLPASARDVVLAGCDHHVDDRVLTATELCELQANGIAIEAHTMTHPRLSAIEPARAAQEVCESKAALEQMLGRPVRYFAYPFGERGDFDAAAESAARAAGFEAAFAAYRGMLGRTANMFALPRIPSNANLHRFKLRLARY